MKYLIFLMLFSFVASADACVTVNIEEETYIIDESGCVPYGR